MLKKTILILECSRIFSLPMSILSWLVVFTYSIIDSGNVFYGLLALIGISFAHLGTNLLDDYFDYKSLIKQVDFDKTEYLKNSQKTKCRYLINGLMKESQLFFMSGLYFAVAFLIGLFLYLKCGNGVLNFATAGAIVAMLYPFVSRICLSEVAVALAYGPILFGGVYYVMCGTIANDIFILSIPTMLMTVVLLYIHTVMDYDYDMAEGKKTIANCFDSQLDSLVLLKVLLILAYIAPILLCMFDIADWQVFFVYITIPMARDLYKSMTEFACDETSVPEKKWYHFPMENLATFRERGEDAFMIRMFQSRNLMIYFSVLMTLGIILSLAI